jgi:hypothetical protein
MGGRGEEREVELSSVVINALVNQQGARRDIMCDEKAAPHRESARFTSAILWKARSPTQTLLFAETVRCKK